MKIGNIYRATNTITGKCYIGFSVNYTQRQDRHKRDSQKNVSKNIKFYNAINKHGWDSFVWEIIYQSYDIQHCKNVMESFFISEHNSYYDGYNSTNGGDGGRGTYKMTNDHKAKIGAANKGRKHSDKFKQLCRERQLNTKASDDTKRKMSLSRIGKKKSVEQKMKNVNASSKLWEITDPSGTSFVVKNLKQYICDNNLGFRLYTAINGKKHKGYSLRRID